MSRWSRWCDGIAFEHSVRMYIAGCAFFTQEGAVSRFNRVVFQDGNVIDVVGVALVRRRQYNPKDT